MLKNVTKNNVFRVVMSVCVVFALCSDTVLTETDNLLNVVVTCMNIDYLLSAFVAVAAYFLFRVTQSQRRDFWMRLLAFIFSTFMLLGRSYWTFNTWDFIFYNTAQFAFAVIVFSGYYLFFEAAISGLCYWVVDNKSSLQFEVKKISLIKLWLILFLSYLPFIIIFFPGSIASDGYKQLRMFFWMEARTTQHPFFATLVMGLIVAAGRLISDNFGIFLFVFLQIAFGSFFIAHVIKWTYEQNIPLWFKRVTLAYFTLIPLWGGYLQCVIKDAMYFVLFMIMCWSFCLILLDERILKSNIMIVAIIIMLAAAALWRREGTIIVPFMLIATFFTIKKYKKRYIAMAAGVYTLILIFEMVIIPFMHVYPGDIYCKYSIIWQMSARYVCDHQGEITEDEADALRAIMNYDELTELYNPLLSSPVKETIEIDSKEERDNYIRVMKSWFVKHPDTFVQAAISHFYGYFYPDFEQHVRKDTQYYIKKYDDNREVLDVHYFMPQWIRDFVDGYTNLWLKIPGVSILLRPSTPLWINLICALLIIEKKKYKYLIGLLPVLLGMGTCFIAPVNGLIRYSIADTACIPLMIVYTLVVVWRENGIVPSTKI